MTGLWWISVLRWLYALAACGLALYGIHTLWMTWSLWRGERRPRPAPGPVAEWPVVTVQIPLYNERHVAQRLIDACARLDYPPDRLQIQVLDDSTDVTRQVVARRVAHWRRRGVDIHHLHRQQRTGYKAGALAAGLAQARGELLAIFDADFLPPPDFLRQVVPHFLGPHNRDVGFVQARWGHLNATYSLLTRSQALALDGHFVVEQAGRQAAGYPLGFNGSAGIWRRACIEDPRVGGWHADTLCEDLDLSYRAQLAGWRPRYLDHVEAPAEIPPQLLAFKRQQFRWAKGSIQTLRKLASRVWRAPWPLAARLAGLFHLGNYLVHPLLLAMLGISLPLLWWDVHPFWPLTYLSLVSIGPPLLYAVAQRRLHPRGWLRRWAYLPVLTLLGTGICLSNSLAVLQALLGREGPFQRTPKFRVESPEDGWQGSAYALSVGPVWLGESALLVYAILAAWIAWGHGNLWAIPFLLLYAGGFALVAGLGLWEGLQARGRRPRRVSERPGPSSEAVVRHRP